MQPSRIGLVQSSGWFAPTLIFFASVLMPFTPVLVPLSTSQVLAQTQDDRKTQADKLLQQSSKQYQTSQFEAAVQSGQQALKVYRQLKDRHGEGQALGNLGITYEAIGDYGKAIEFNQQALAIMRELKDRQGEGQVLGNLGNAYTALGDYKKATESYQQSLTIAQETKDRVGEGVALGSLGIIYANLGDYNEAIKSYQKSLAIAGEIKDREGEGNTLVNLGAAYQAQGNNSEAIKSYQQSLAIAQEIKNRRIEQVALGSLGVAYESLSDYPKAIQHHEQSLAIAQETGDRRGKALALNNLGHTLFVSGKLGEAEGKLRLAVQVLDSLRSGLDDQGKVSIFDTQAATYNLLQQILVAQNKPEASLEVSEQSRARAFVELLTTRLNTNSATQAATQAAIAPPTIQQIQKIAQAQKATLVEYSIVPDDFLHQGKQRAPELELLIWVVQPTGQVALRRVDLKSLRHQNTSLAELVFEVRDSLVGSPPSIDPESLKQLHQLLIQPVADLLPTDPTARVIFIPHESLFLVPFAALQNPNNEYLVKQHTILTAPAIQVLDLTHQQRQSIQGLANNSLVVGNPTMPTRKLGDPPERLKPLPASQQEAIEIARLLNTKAITGNQATKLDIVNQMPRARIIHLATHGLLDELQQLDVPGAIALAPSGNDDGFLTSREILNLKLNAELVVLSACKTGRGEITGDGVIGLSRSLISAGTPSVVVALWSVPDAPTGSLMTGFYHNFQSNADKAQALRQAMLTTMKQHPDPVNWAAFTLIGEAE